MKNNVIFKGMKKVMKKRYGKEIAAKIWARAEDEYSRLITEFPDVKGDGKNMYNAAAIYIALRGHDPENALSVMTDYGRQFGVKMRKTVHALTSIPFVPELMWKKMPSIMDKASGEAKGYTRRIVGATNELVGVDILTCPINDAAIEMGVPEAAAIVCAMDKEYMSGFRHINYTRTMSVAEGGECCDYRMSYNKDKR